MHQLTSSEQCQLFKRKTFNQTDITSSPVQCFESVFNWYGSGSDTDPDPIRIQSSDAPKVKQKIDSKSTSKLQKKPSALKREHPLLEHPENIYFCGSLLPSWIRIRIPIMDPDTDPRTCLNPDPILIRIRIRNTGHNSKGRYLSIYPFYMFRSPISGWPQAVLHSGKLSAALIPPLLPARLFIAAPSAALLIRIEPEHIKENKLCVISTMTTPLNAEPEF